MRNEKFKVIAEDGLELEIRPVVLLDKKGEIIPHGTKGKDNSFEQDESEKDPRAIWGVYHHVRGEGVYNITDCATKKGAEFVAELLQRLYKATGKLPKFPVQ